MSENQRIGCPYPGDAEDVSAAIDSMPFLGMGELDSEHGVVLKDWSAQDFANIYVRFRPVLMSHARKFLRDESQTEEVVQDAFLYLMTALPELDSELGVLRFLKWKTRLLCLDVIRSQGSNPIFGASPLDDATTSSNADLTESIERADDAAIVRLALAQLSPRHREAIVATVFEEKSTQQVAQEMGLSENAFRQLLLRARNSFKTIFVGEVESANMSVSQALNLAAKRHRLKLISGGSLLFILVAASVVPEGGPGPMPIPSTAQVAQSSLGLGNESLRDAGPVATDIIEPQGDFAEEPSGSDSPQDSEEITTEITSVTEARPVSGPVSVNEPTQAALADVDDGLQGELRVLLASEITDNPLRVSAYGSIHANRLIDEWVLRQGVSENLTLVAHFAPSGVTSDYRPSKIYFEDSRNGHSLIWLAQTFASERLRTDGNGRTYLDVVATDFLVGDFGGAFGNVAVKAGVGSAPKYLRFQISIEESEKGFQNVKLVGSSDA